MVIIFAVVLAWSIHYYKDYKKAILRALLAAYFYFILALTLIGRTPASAPKAEWMPFWSWVRVFKGPRSLSQLQEIGLNILLFIPFGALLELNWNIPLIRTMLIGFSISFIIEVTQYFTCLGLFEWDDMMHNALGCLLGALVIRTLSKKRSG